jgi:protease I
MAKVAIVLENDYEDSEYEEPVRRLKAAGHQPILVGTEKGKRLEGKARESRATVDCTPKDAKVADFDALVIPGGYSPDQLRTHEDIVAFVVGFRDAGKPIAAVCHGPSLLVDADCVRGRRLTSWPSIRRDLRNAGGDVVDEPVVEDGNLITSRNPDDLPAFCDALLARLA